MSLGPFRLALHRDPAAALRDWQELSRSAAMTAFQRPDWLAAWYEVTSRHKRAEPLIAIVHELSSGRPVMALPLCLHGKAGERIISFADLRVGDYAAPVIARDVHPSPCDLARILAAIGRAVPGADRIHLEKIVSEVAGQPNPLARLPGLEPHPFRSHLVHLGPGWREAWHRALGAAHLKEFRRKRRHLAERGPLTFLAVSGDAEALVIFDWLVAARRRRFGILGRDDILADPVWHDFYRTAVAGSAGSSCMSMIALKVDGAIVAAACGIVHDRVYHMVLSAFGQGMCDRASPGLLLVEDALGWAERSGFEAFDLTVGDEPYKALFASGTSAVHEWMQPLSLRGRASALVWRLKVRLRRHPRLRRLLRQIRWRRPLGPAAPVA
ncbi:MAG: GNAT family N-acetyltransferase [Hyphomicrobiaceae bacterium]